MTADLAPAPSTGDDARPPGAPDRFGPGGRTEPDLFAGRAGTVLAPWGAGTRAPGAAGAGSISVDAGLDLSSGAADFDAEALAALAAASGAALVDLDGWEIDGSQARRLPESVARRHHVLLIGSEGDALIVATADPFDVVALDDLRSVLGAEVRIALCSRTKIADYLERVYRRHEETERAARSAALAVGSGDAVSEAAPELRVGAGDAPVVQFVDLILAQALSERASDVHVEPHAEETVVRLRVDGVLHEMTRAPRSIHASVLTRLKVMARLDIAEHRIPQDGRLSLALNGQEVDLRVATLPTVHGEKVVLRILDKSTAPLELDRLGFRPEVLERYAAAYRRPSGVILVTGPTGSGKSTTLYATLAELNDPGRNLITVEDPVEYQLAGVNQVPVNPKAGLSFANALRSILRSDPDVVLVGEIRDEDTAAIAVGAALTGHLVLSCLHTNDASSTPQRLVEMGVEPFLVATAIDCVLAQRLVRVLCEHCAAPVALSADELRAGGFSPEALSDLTPRFRRAVGCQACGGTGFRGRIAVQELLLVSEEIERAILGRATHEDIARLAVAQGMRPLRDDGLVKAALGMTSLEEIQRVVR